MDPHFWPPYGLRLRTPRLELRLPGIPLLDELAAVAADEGDWTAYRRGWGAPTAE